MTTEIRKKCLGSILDNGDANYRLALKQGSIDGAANIPETSSTSLSDWEGKFLETCKSAWDSYQSLMKIEREKGMAEFNSMTDELQRDSSRAEESLGVRQKKSLDLLESEMGESSMVYRRLKADYEEKRDSVIDLEKKLGRPLQISFVKGYMPLMVMLALAEVQVNRLAFELFFESMPAVSLLLAAAVGALLMFFAHIIGKQFRHTQCSITSKNNSSVYFGIFGLLIVCFLLMYSLGVMREELVRVQNAGQINLEDMSLDDLAKGGAKAAGFSLALGTTGAFLLLLNFVIFLTGLVGSYFRHDSHPYFERLTRDFESAKKAFEDHQTKFESRQVEILREFAAESVKTDSELKDKETLINEMSKKRAVVDRDLSSARESMIVELARCLRAYRSENLANRTTPPPHYFTESVNILAREAVKS